MREPIEAIADFLGWKVHSHPSQSGTIMYTTVTGKFSEVIRVGKSMIPWVPPCVKRTRLAEVIAYAESRPQRIIGELVPEIERLYWEEGLSRLEVGERLGFTENQVSYAMKKFGFPFRTKSEQIKRAYATGRRARQWKHDYAARERLATQIEESYWGQGKSAYEIASEIGVSHSLVFRLMSNFQIPRRTPSEALSLRGQRLLGRGREDLRELLLRIETLYWDEGKSQRQVALEIGLGSSRVFYLMKRYGIPARTKSEATKLVRRRQRS